MQVCTSLGTDNYASTSPLSFLQAGWDALTAAQPTQKREVTKLKTQHNEGKLYN